MLRDSSDRDAFEASRRFYEDEMGLDRKTLRKAKANHYCEVILQWVPLVLVFLLIGSVGTYFVGQAINYGQSNDNGDDDKTLKGMGTEFSSDLMLTLTVVYSSSSTTTNYVTAETDEALKNLLDGTVAFAVTDYTVDRDRLEAEGIQMLPFAASGQVLITNLFYSKNNTKTIVLTRDTIVQIYNGNVVYWDDPMIVQNNPNRTFPHTPITALHRTDSSLYDADTNLFLNALCSFNPNSWTVCDNASSSDWPVPNPWSHSSITDDSYMAAAVENNAASIGYVSLDQKGKFSNPGIINRLGQTVYPTLDTIGAAMDNAYQSGWTSQTEFPTILDQSCDQCWPISTYSFILFKKDQLSKDCDEATELYQFLTWAYGSDTENYKTKHSFVALGEKATSDITNFLSTQVKSCLHDKKPKIPLVVLCFIVGFAFTVLGIVCVIFVRYILRRRNSRNNNGYDSEERKNLLQDSSTASSLKNINFLLEKSVILKNNEELVFQKIIGKGTFSTVYSGLWRGTTVAIKKINNQEVIEKQLSPPGNSLEREIELMSSLRHPNVVLLLFACVKPDYIYIVTEMCSRGSLFDLIHNKQVKMDFNRQLQMAIDAARGMLYLHTHEPMIIHRDLKSSNLLVDKDWNLKVADFGISVAVDNQRMLTGNMGTVEYMAPECLRNTTYTEKCDVYSYGVVLCELFTRESLYPDMTVVQIRFMVRTQSLRPTLTNYIPRALKNLIQDCWQTDPELRPSFSQILEQLVGFQQQPEQLNADSPGEKERSKRSQGIYINRALPSILSQSEKDHVMPLYDSV